MHQTFNQRVLGTRVRRLALTHLYLWNQVVHLDNKTTSKSMVYHMVKSRYYKQVQPLMFPSKRLYQRNPVSKRKQKTRFTPVDQRRSKQWLIKEEGYYKADSVIGKRTDKKAIASLIELKSGKVRLSFYQRTTISFAYSQKNKHLRMNLHFKSLSIDNGKENNKLDQKFAKSEIYNCYACYSWEKVVIENMHYSIKRIILKSKFSNNYQDHKQIGNFVNFYYKPRCRNA